MKEGSGFPRKAGPHSCIFSLPPTSLAWQQEKMLRIILTASGNLLGSTCASLHSLHLDVVQLPAPVSLSLYVGIAGLSLGVLLAMGYPEQCMLHFSLLAWARLCLLPWCLGSVNLGSVTSEASHVQASKSNKSEKTRRQKV